jgi:hypothetical protein
VHIAIHLYHLLCHTSPKLTTSYHIY